ncbi:hypothetical protein BDZ91DRAFT_348394 [Kalaharituber pfeilii]|nr:hypothetical protein BDZ91DRAFT_348394 [Kalaharituber pfeilii]
MPPAKATRAPRKLFRRICDCLIYNTPPHTLKSQKECDAHQEFKQNYPQGLSGTNVGADTATNKDGGNTSDEGDDETEPRPRKRHRLQRHRILNRRIHHDSSSEDEVPLPEISLGNGREDLPRLSPNPLQIIPQPTMPSVSVSGPRYQPFYEEIEDEDFNGGLSTSHGDLMATQMEFSPQPPPKYITLPGPVNRTHFPIINFTLCR